MNFCGKSFSQLGKKHIHIVHEGHKDFKCESCGRSFSLLHHLKRHILAHENRKDFKCISCDKSFYEAGKLKQHNRIVRRPQRSQM